MESVTAPISPHAQPRRTIEELAWLEHLNHILAIPPRFYGSSGASYGFSRVEHTEKGFTG